MATLDTVLDALKALCLSAVYPNGIDQPSIIESDVLFRKGEPNPPLLDPELKSGKARVNFYDGGNKKDVSRFPYHEWDTVYITPPTIVLTVSQDTITLSGTVATDQSILVVVDNDHLNPYSYEIEEGDTLDTIATNLAALIPDATALGAVITVNNIHALEAHMVTQGLAIRETQRQEHLMKICIRASNTEHRQIITDAIIKQLGLYPSFPLENEYSVRLIPKNDQNNDRLQKANLLERTLTYQTEYSTVETQTYYTIADPVVTTTRNQNIH